MNGKIHINVTNTDQREFHICKGQNIRAVDLRSVGCFHIIRDSIQRCLHDRFIFLNEEESQDYFSLMHTNNDKTLQISTKPDMRKTPFNETKKSPRQYKYFKDDAEKNPYPWSF